MTPASELTVKRTSGFTRFFVAGILCLGVFALRVEDAHAQRRIRPIHTRVAPVFFGYGHPVYGYGFSPFWWGYPGWHPYGWNVPFGPGARYAAFGSARLQVKPRDAEVYVDGHRAGTVDDFDGVFQRLDMPPGGHELTIHMPGYKTFSQKVLFRPGATVNIKHELEPLAAGETASPPPAPAERFGTIAIRVQPRDAIVVVNGQEWKAVDSEGPVLIELREGTHEIEIRLAGFTTYRRTVRVRAGETQPVNVSLSRVKDGKMAE
jgi:hypothetical protein